MATVIDQLLVTLGLDASGVKKGAAEATEAQDALTIGFEKTGKASEEASKRAGKAAKDDADQRRKFAAEQTKQNKEQGEQTAKLTQGLAAMKSELLGVIAALTGGAAIKDFLTDTIATTAAIGRLSQNLNISAQALAGWQGFARSAGSTSAAASSALQAVAAIQFGIDTGHLDLEVGRAMQFFGLNRESFRDPSQGLLAIAAGIDQRRAAGATNRDILGFLAKLGISDPNLQNAFLQGNVAGRFGEEERRNPLTKEQAQATQAAQKSWADLNTEFGYVSEEIVTALAPAIIGLTKVLDGFVKWAADHPKLATAIFTALTAAIAGLTLVLGYLAIAALAADVALAPIILTIAGIAAAVAGIVAVGSIPQIKGDLQDLGTALDQVGQDLSGVFGPIIDDLIKTSLTQLHLHLRLAIDELSQLHAAMHRDWSTVWKLQGQIVQDREAIAGAPITQGVAQGRAWAQDPGLKAAGAKAAAQVAGAADLLPNIVTGRGQSRADRNNNPGNLEDSSGHYRVFPTMQAGILAMGRQILLDFYRHGQKTIRQLIGGPHGWSPANAPGNSVASTANYEKYVASQLDVGVDAPINMGDPNVLRQIIVAMAAFESGRRRGSVTALPNLAGLAVGAAASPAVTNNSPRSSSVTAATHINALNISVPHGDPNAIAVGMNGALKRNTFVPQFATSLA